MHSLLEGFKQVVSAEKCLKFGEICLHIYSYYHTSLYFHRQRIYIFQNLSDLCHM